MSVAQHFDIQSTGIAPEGSHIPGGASSVLRVVGGNRAPIVERRRIIVALDSVMFTGRVPVSTWTFVVQVGHKLWVSDRETMYFGKPAIIRRPVYHDTINIEDHRIDLNVGISAYNSYGDLLKTMQPLRFYQPADNLAVGTLLQLEQNWMQLVFKFKLKVI